MDEDRPGAGEQNGAAPPRAPAAHRLFVAVALVFGLAYAVLTPPNASPDEIAHQVKIVRVAGGNPFGNDPDLPLPDVEGWYGAFDNARMSSGPYGFGREDVRDVVDRPLDCRSEPRSLSDQVASYSPVLYALPAVAYKVSCGLGRSFGFYLYAARIANLLLCVALIAAAIGVSPLTRWPIFYVSLLPSSLFELASISADAMLIAVGMLYVAVVAGVAGGQVGPRRGIWLVTVLGILVSFSKPSYYWLSWFGLAAWPRFRRASLPDWLIAICLALLPLLFQGALLALGLKAAAQALPDGVDPRVNLEALVHHPFRLIPMIARVPSKFPFGTQWNIYESLVGKLGWLTVPLPPALYALAALGFVGAAGAGRVPSMPGSLRGAAALVGSASVVAISLPLYLYATPLGSKAILGLQGRYFLPTAALLLVACSFRSGRRGADAAAVGVVAVSLGLLCASLYRFVRVYYA